MSVIDKTKQYKTNTFDSKVMEPLAKGQQPHTLFITCSDSRISVNELTQSKPGEVFVIRNAGNLVDKYDEKNPTKESLTVEYAVQVLKVSEIVVCGHSSCGAMGALKDMDSVKELKLIKNGLEPIAKDYADKKALDLSVDDLIAFNVAEQIRKLSTYSYIEEAQKAGTLKVSGWVYDFANGDIIKEITYEDALSGSK